ncbi:MAG: N-acetylmuramoyl-L-alanine amidase [Bacteroides sp.]|nr:N-acetylmuramoyl-L-alanine amidase [Eubacterium sp.]MCM1418307.1 N-acetylmuramoyl-L-alanine amidase [Roseburia sp.]MCM1462410.1 N-acetylmuramoyl-L-alanine amidase [Bacteroides sp.]
MIRFKHFIASFLTASIFVSSAALPASADPGESGSDLSALETADEPMVAEASTPQYMFVLPENMRASILTPSIDYLLTEEISEKSVTSELETIFAEFSEIGLNTVILNTVYEDRSYYSIDVNEEAFDPTEIALRVAYNYGISPYIVLDLSHLLIDKSENPSRIDTLVSRVHRFALKYPCDGIILDDYYLRRNVESFGEYMDDGSGIGYMNWLYDTAEQLFSTAADVIHRTNNSIAVGFMINDMWANASDNSLGSETADPTQALYDGYSDTKSFIEKGYVDFALLRAYGSLTDGALPFESVTGWWGTLTADYEIPMYIVHYNEKIGTDAAGWNSEDQLLKQLTVAEKLDSYHGSVFNSYSRLTQNPLGTTSTLTSYFNENINKSSLFEDLKMVSPAKLSFTTSEPTVTFMGSFDSNFPVYFNNAPIQLNDAGNFYFSRDLSVGMNTFTITHKSKTYTYKIERKIIVMKSISSSISEGKSLRVEGGTKIKLSVTAYKGSNVYGVVNGQTVPMTESETKTDDEDVNSSYVRYTGSYTAPEGIIGQEQNLGTIKIFGSNSGYSMEVSGASVTVNALPEPIVEKKVELLDANSVGSGEVIGTLESVYGASDTVKYVRINANYTMIYDGKTTDDIPSPEFSPLPAGTIEPYSSTSGSYYLTASGKRISTESAELIDGSGIDQNALIVKSVGTSGGESYIKIGLEHKTGFNMRLVGNSYYTAWDGDYNLSSLTATHLYITFENITSVTKLPSFENNMVFKSGKWDTVTEANGTKFRLILELRQPGVYFGHSARYDDNGDLMLYFKVPTNLLSGLTIVVDPGHGYGKTAGTYDPGAVGEVIEQEVVLAIAKELTAELQAAGANVIRLKTENPTPFLLTRKRPSYARDYGCDLYLSVHANKANATARGVEVYYFTSYSQPLATSISSSLATYYAGNVYTDGANKNRGAKYSYYSVTLPQDFPSVLIETGFVDQIDDAMALASPTHQNGIAKAIVAGIKNFIARSSISYASEGSTVVDAPTETDDTEETAPLEDAETPEETTAPDEANDPGGSEGLEEEDDPDITTLPPDPVSSEETTAPPDNPDTAEPSDETSATESTETTTNPWFVDPFESEEPPATSETTAGWLL